MRASIWHILAVCTLLLAIAFPHPALAQDQAEEPEQEEVADQPDYPPTFEVSSRYRSLVEDATQARERVSELSDVTTLEGELYEVEERQQEIEQLLMRFGDVDYVRSERINHLRTEAVSHDQHLDMLQTRAVDRLEELDEMRSEWNERRQFWSGWRTSLEGTEEFAFVEPEFQRSLERIDNVLETIQDAVPYVLEYQGAVDELREDAQALITDVADLQAGGREARVSRGQPVLFSPNFLSSLRADGWRGWQPVTALRSPDYSSFFADNAGIIFFHLVVLGILGIGARRIRSHSIPEGAWSGLLLRPWALAVFTSTAIFFYQYALPPPIWDVLMWILMASSGTRLAKRLFKRPAMRSVIYFFAIFYPLFHFAEAIQLPIPLFRIALLGAALAAIFLFGTYLLHEPQEGTDNRVKWVLWLSIVVWALVLIAETLGFYLLARWLLHAAVTSAFVVLVVGFLFVMSRGAVRTLVRIESTGRLQTIGIPVVERILKLLQLIILIGGVLIVLHLWELTPPPAESWEIVTSTGFPIAGVEITLGRLILAGILIYITVLASWLMRTFARSELYPNWELERGVGDSINSLLHYSLIAIGIMLGLGAIGVELQNFAIIVGALGVGIGFGLQNIVNNFVSGLILLFERPIRVGDTVMIDDEFGVIEKIGLRATNVTTFDRSELIVPNGHLVSEKVVNWTLSDPIVRLIIPVGVAYGSDVDRVKELLIQVASAHPAVMTEPTPNALFLEFGDSSLDFELRIWIQDLRERMLVKSALLSRIEQLFAENDIEVPFPQRDLHVRSIQEDIMSASKVLGEKSGDSAENTSVPVESLPEPPDVEPDAPTN